MGANAGGVMVSSGVAASLAHPYSSTPCQLDTIYCKPGFGLGMLVATVHFPTVSFYGRLPF